MNKQIKELASKANFGHINDNDEVAFDVRLEKFAELIVRECCSIADEVERADTGMFASKYIKAHFGVEE